MIDEDEGQLDALYVESFIIIYEFLLAVLEEMIAAPLPLLFVPP
jgi:hypothetical protein